VPSIVLVISSLGARLIVNIMTSNALRGGKNIYGPRTLTSNWLEERFEPKHQAAQLMSLDQLPSKTAKTWSRTADEIGVGSKEMMMKKYSATETSNWLKYQKDGPDRYNTTSGVAFVNPTNQVPVFQAPYIPEEKLVDYRATWTNGEPHLFEIPDKVGTVSKTRTITTGTLEVTRKAP